MLRGLDHLWVIAMNGIPKFIGLTGKAGCGKTTTAHFLADILKEYMVVMNIPFSYRLKLVAKRMGWDGIKDSKGRRMLQILGTEVGRETLGPDFWVNEWIKEIGNATEHIITPNCTAEGCLIIIADDIRFDNEAMAIRSRMGKVWEITGRRIDGMTPVELNHISERGITPALVDSRITNDGTLKELREKIKDQITQDIRDWKPGNEGGGEWARSSS